MPRGKRNEVPRHEVHEGESDSGGPAEPLGEYWPTGCEEHVRHLQTLVRNLQTELDVERQARAVETSRLREQLGKCYATRPVIRAATDVALRALADNILEQVTKLLEGCNVASDDPGDEEERQEREEQKEGY